MLVLGPAIGVLVGATIAGIRRGERKRELAITAAIAAAGGLLVIVVVWFLDAVAP